MLEMSYIPSGLNPADYYSRKLTRSDAILSAASWAMPFELWAFRIGPTV